MTHRHILKLPEITVYLEVERKKNVVTMEFQYFEDEPYEVMDKWQSMEAFNKWLRMVNSFPLWMFPIFKGLKVPPPTHQVLVEWFKRRAKTVRFEKKKHTTV